MTDKIAALARANSKDGMRNLHLMPFVGANPDTPKVTGVNFSRLVLSRAIYDEKKDALIVTCKPGKGAKGYSAFNITRLQTFKVYDLFRDGQLVSTYDDIRELRVAVDLTGKHDFVLIGHDDKPIGGWERPIKPAKPAQQPYPSEKRQQEDTHQTAPLPHA